LRAPASRVGDVLKHEPAVDQVRRVAAFPRLIDEHGLGVVDAEALAVGTELLQHRRSDVHADHLGEVLGHRDQKPPHAAADLDGQVLARKLTGDLLENPRRAIAARLEELVR
jgi:hypothetical protein